MTAPRDADAYRPLIELSSTGLLWLINRTCFHPHGFALALQADDDGAVTGWQLQGDGTEVWSFGTDLEEAEPFALAQATLDAQRRAAQGG